MIVEIFSSPLCLWQRKLCKDELTEVSFPFVDSDLNAYDDLNTWNQAILLEIGVLGEIGTRTFARVMNGASKPGAGELLC